ncbi:hypothetical protein ACFXKY_07840 [Streptomyces canus]|uniref:hypothetical protein n=1 Tax=Streptomyces canus TaxID=58343 RepID=UPI00369EE97B
MDELVRWLGEDAAPEEDGQPVARVPLGRICPDSLVLARVRRAGVASGPEPVWVAAFQSSV